MIARAVAFFDWETGRVLGVTVGAVGLTLSQVNAALTTVVLIGSAIYTWRKALRRRPPEGEE